MHSKSGFDKKELVVSHNKLSQNFIMMNHDQFDLRVTKKSCVPASYPELAVIFS